MSWTATHRVPEGGLESIVNNEPSTPLDAGLEVQLVETSGEWARVVASNGWECWVNAAALEPVAGGAAAPPVLAAAPVPTPVAAAPAAVPVAAAPAKAKRGRLVPILIVVIVLLLIAGGAGGGYLILNANAADVTLESAGTQSAQPFNPEVVTPPATATPSAAQTAAPTAPPAQAAPKGPSGVAIYGGSGNNRVCDKAKLVQFLTTHPAEARAWADIQGITVEQIPSFIQGLTPQILSQDMRITNHGFANGRATTYQSVFQAGTAVLVNQYGYAVVRCLCGNPLTPAVSNQRYRYTGQRWPGFNPTTIIIIVAPPGNVPNVPTTVPNNGQKPSLGSVAGNYTLKIEGAVQTVGNAGAIGLTCNPSKGATFPATVTQTGNQVVLDVKEVGSSSTGFALTGTIDPLGHFDLKGSAVDATSGISIVYKGNVDLLSGAWDGQLEETFNENGTTAACKVRITAKKN